MKADTLERLIKQAKTDSQFFHDLVWDTEKVLGSVSYLSRGEKAAILAISPEDLVAGLATGRLGGGAPAAECGGTCGASCGGSCGASCGGSCTVTCAASCPATGLMPSDKDQVINPATDFGVNTQQLIDQISQVVVRRPFTRFSR